MGVFLFLVPVAGASIHNNKNLQKFCSCNLSIACFKSINHTTLITKDRTRRSFVISGGSGWIRTSSGLSQQIYSLPRLSNSGARPNLFATTFMARHTKPWRSVVRAEGIEPSFQAWKACILAFVLCPQQIQSPTII